MTKFSVRLGIVPKIITVACFIIMSFALIKLTQVLLEDGFNIVYLSLIILLLISIVSPVACIDICVGRQASAQEIIGQQDHLLQRYNRCRAVLYEKRHQNLRQRRILGFFRDILQPEDRTLHCIRRRLQRSSTDTGSNNSRRL